MSNIAEQFPERSRSKNQGNKLVQWITVILLVYLLIAAVGMIGTGFKSATGERAEQLFIYVNSENLRNKPELEKFMQFYGEDIGKWLPFVGYVILVREAYKLVSESFEKKIIGTVYRGQLNSEVKIEEMLQKESVF